MTRFSRVGEKKVTVHNHESNMIAKKRPIHTLSNLDRKRPWKRKGRNRAVRNLYQVSTLISHEDWGRKKNLSRFTRGFYNVLSKGFFLTITVGSILLLLL